MREVRSAPSQAHAALAITRSRNQRDRRTQAHHDAAHKRCGLRTSACSCARMSGRLSRRHFTVQACVGSCDAGGNFSSFLPNSSRTSGLCSGALTRCLSFRSFSTRFYLLPISSLTLLSLFSLLSLSSISPFSSLSGHFCSGAHARTTAERRGKPQRVDNKGLAADLREGLSCGHMVGTSLRVLPLSTTHSPSKTEERRYKRRGRARVPSPGKRVEPSLAGMITAAREEEHRARDSGTAAEDTLRRPAARIMKEV